MPIFEGFSGEEGQINNTPQESLPFWERNFFVKIRLFGVAETVF